LNRHIIIPSIFSGIYDDTVCIEYNFVALKKFIEMLYNAPVLSSPYAYNAAVNMSRF
jgi:hypothetical protein